MLNRRAVVAGWGCLSAVPSAACARPSEEPASPALFGARAGRLSRAEAIRNVAALKAAFESGRLIDGGGATYEIHGELRITAPPRLRRLTLRQTSVDPKLEKTVVLDGLSAGQIVIEDFVIDLADLQQDGGMGQCSALQISNCASAVLTRVTVRNAGAITGIKIIATPGAVLRDIVIQDFKPRFLREPENDVCQGVEFQLCRGFSISNARVSGLVAQWPGRPALSRQYSRGVVCGSSTGGRIAKSSIGPGVEQGVDISGRGNRRISVIGNRILDAGTWGVKCANWFNDIIIADNQIIRPGCAGITCSAPGDANGDLPGDVQITGNEIVNPGASGLWRASEPAGIILYARQEAGTAAPYGVVARRNRIIDDQSAPTMTRAFDSIMVGPSGAGPTRAWLTSRADRPNIEFDNLASGFTIERSRGWQSG